MRGLRSGSRWHGRNRIDMLSIQGIINVINSFKEHGTSVLLITHREDISLVADKASQLCQGKIICTGDPGKVADNYKSRSCLVCNVPPDFMFAAYLRKLSASLFQKSQFISTLDIRPHFREGADSSSRDPR